MSTFSYALIALCLTGQTVQSFSSQKVKTGFAMFTGGFSSISSSVSDSGPASVSSSGSGADSDTNIDTI